MRACPALFLLILLLPANAQNAAWESWDPVLIRGLHTAEGIPYLTEEEQKVILFMNMARYDGALFAETFLEAYVQERKVENTSYLRSLQRDLKKSRDIPLLYPEEDLTAIARGHAERSGRTGHVGHRDINRRFEPVKGNPYMTLGENCSYGYRDAIDIVITLLIDEGIRDVGHRKNSLNPVFNSVGVAIWPHKGYGVNCVMDFGGKTPPDLNSLPY